MLGRGWVCVNWGVYWAYREWCGISTAAMWCWPIRIVLWASWRGTSGLISWIRSWHRRRLVGMMRRATVLPLRRKMMTTVNHHRLYKPIPSPSHVPPSAPSSPKPPTPKASTSSSTATACTNHSTVNPGTPSWKSSTKHSESIHAVSSLRAWNGERGMESVCFPGVYEEGWVCGECRFGGEGWGEGFGVVYYQGGLLAWWWC